MARLHIVFFAGLLSTHAIANPAPREEIMVRAGVRYHIVHTGAEIDRPSYRFASMIGVVAP